LPDDGHAWHSEPDKPGSAAAGDSAGLRGGSPTPAGRHRPARLRRGDGPGRLLHSLHVYSMFAADAVSKLSHLSDWIVDSFALLDICDLFSADRE